MELELVMSKRMRESAEAQTHGSTSSSQPASTHFISTGCASFYAKEEPQQDDNAPPQHQCIAGNVQPPIRSITRNPCLKSALRILKGNRETANPVVENVVKDVKPSISGPFSEQEMNLDALSHVKKPQQGALQPPPEHQKVDDKFQPPRENSMVPQDKHVPKRITTPGVPSSSRCLRPSHSLNMTEYARGLENDSDDGRDVVESAPPGHDYVHGHMVKTEFAHLVGAIFEKYGDITGECDFKSKPNRLEELCVVYQTLEKRKLSDLTHAQISDMLDDLRLFKTHKLDVG